MNKILEYLVAGLIAAAATGVVAGVVVWKIGERQREFVAKELAAQSTKIQDVGSELAKTAADLKALNSALHATNETLGQVKDHVSLVGTRSGIAELNGKIEAANKALADIKQATAPEQAKSALAPLGAKLDATGKRLTAVEAKLDDKSGDKTRDEALTRIEAAIAGVKDAVAKPPADPGLTQANTKLDDGLKSLATIRQTIEALKGNGTDTAKLDEATKSLAAIKASIDAMKSHADADTAKLEAAWKSIAALDTSVKKGFGDAAASQTALLKAAEKPAPAPPPAKSQQDLVVFYVSMAGATPAPSPPPPAKGEPGLTPVVPPPYSVRFERIGGVDDEGQTKLIVDKVRTLIKGHSGCSIAVAGHADTLGGDRTNYELSKRRANEVTDKLRAAFAGEPIPVSETQWGERRLAEWTPDGTARQANRRVDVAVSCEK